LVEKGNNKTLINTAGLTVMWYECLWIAFSDGEWNKRGLNSKNGDSRNYASHNHTENAYCVHTLKLLNILLNAQISALLK